MAKKKKENNVAYLSRGAQLILHKHKINVFEIGVVNH